MGELIFKVDIEEKKIVDDKQILKNINILEQVKAAIDEEEDITKYIFLNDKGDNYEFLFVKANLNLKYYKLKQVRLFNNKKGKYSKIEMKKRSIEKIAKDIGFVNAQQIHAVDYHEYSYIPLKQYLKANRENFKKQFIFEKGYNHEYRILRHKNLFSKYRDEVSDFEKLTTIEKLEAKSLKVSYEIDEDIFDFDDGGATIQDRKFMREFAKDIYTKKNYYSERELFDILTGRDLYVRVINTTPKEHKDVWSKVSVKDMDIRVLEKSRNNFQKQDVPDTKQRKYRSKRQRVRKHRRENQRASALVINEYFEHEENRY